MAHKLSKTVLDVPLLFWRSVHVHNFRQFCDFEQKMQFLAYFCPFWALMCNTFLSIKIDPGVVHTFQDLFWKAQTSYFPILRKFWNFEYFCNPNGIHQIWLPKRNIFGIVPFWLQKGIKIEKCVDANFISEKYGSSPFQNMSWNVSTTSGYDFMALWRSVKTLKKWGGLLKK